MAHVSQWLSHLKAAQCFEQQVICHYGKCWLCMMLLRQSSKMLSRLKRVYVNIQDLL